MKFPFHVHPENLRKSAHHILDNGLFWMVLFLLTIGGVTTFYYQGQIALNVTSPSAISDKSSKNHRVGEKELPIYCVQTAKPQIALSFDAAWGNEQTDDILNILSKHQIKATFFMTGSWVEKFPQDVVHIQEEGHDLGNHGEHHKNMSQLDKGTMKEEILDVHNRVKKLTGENMVLFRPPYGDYDNEVIATVCAMGYYPVQWDVDSLDWKDYGSQSIIDTVVNNKHLNNGSIILMHNGAKYTLDALDSVILGLKAKGFEFVPISKLIQTDNYHLDQEGRQISDLVNWTGQNY